MLFDMFIVMYLFLGGCSAGLLFVTSLLGLMSRHTASRSSENVNVFGGYMNRCHQVNLVIALASSACLLCDLGSPNRAYLLFSHPTATPISVGAFVLVVNVVVCVLLVVCSGTAWRDSSRSESIERALDWIGLPASIMLMSYTGVFLALIKQVPLWNSPLTVVLFVVSALSAGISLSMLIRDTDGADLDRAGFNGALHIAHGTLLVVEIVTIAAFVAVTASRPEVAAARSLELLSSPPLSQWIAFGVVGFGLAFPLCVEVVESASWVARALSVTDPRTALPGLSIPSNSACLIGCFLLRYCLIAAGLH